MRRLHLRWRSCSLCGATRDLSLHHILPRRPHLGDDVEDNLVMLCGDGVRGCHGLIHLGNPVTLGRMNEHIREERPDVLDYLEQKLGDQARAAAWLDRRYPPADPTGTLREA